jgi:hypothetical protein
MYSTPLETEILSKEADHFQGAGDLTKSKKNRDFSPEVPYLRQHIEYLKQ